MPEPRQAPAAERLLVVSPVYNEGGHIDRTARAVAAQERPPDRWVIVDDGSRDDTLAIAQRWARELPFLTVMSAGDAAEGPDRLALAREARAFNLGIEAAGWRDFTHVGKLDGDVELPPHWFATLLARFRDEPELGLAGGRLEEPSPRGWEQIPIPDSHIHGAVKLYRRECLEAIGGIVERLAWDTIDETYARMRGYSTHSLPELVARHHRHWGSADGRLRGRARHGECAWVLHQSAPWALLRSLKLARVPPAGLSGAAFAYGYARAAVRRTPRVDDVQFRRFVRRELRGRMLSPLRPVRQPAVRPLATVATRDSAAANRSSVT
jgi:poly-beta-1,6-N-acetyl-D-glucosamine synthase